MDLWFWSKKQEERFYLTTGPCAEFKVKCSYHLKQRNKTELYLDKKKTEEKSKERRCSSSEEPREIIEIERSKSRKQKTTLIEKSSLQKGRDWVSTHSSILRILFFFSPSFFSLFSPTLLFFVLTQAKYFGKCQKKEALKILKEGEARKAQTKEPDGEQYKNPKRNK